MAAEVLLRCEQLVKLYETATGRVQAVRGVDLDVDEGATIAIIGPSGSGKSSLLRMIAGLDRPTAGVVTLDGVDLWRLSERRRAAVRSALITHIHQRPSDNLFSHLSAEMQLARVVKGHGGTGLVDQWLAALDLDDRRRLRPAQMSGGERQRLAFARAAVSGHRLVIADEPTAQLDSVNTDAVLDAVDELAAAGITTVVATHDQRVLGHVDEVIELRDGAIATVNAGGEPLSVIDRSGRLQLPPELRDRFPDGRVRLRWDNESDRVEIELP